MSTETKGSGWLCAALVLAACYVPLPETIAYHQARVLKLPLEPSQSLVEAEVTRAAKAYQLPARLLHALVRVESGYKLRAVSPVGARGLSQVMPVNAKRCGLPSADHLWDAVTNLRCGAQILREEFDRLGNIEDALAVYNCGRVKCYEGQKYAKKVVALSTAR